MFNLHPVLPPYFHIMLIPLSNSSYNTTFSFSLTNNLFSRMFASKIKFPIFRFTIAMVWNNLAAFSTFITFVATSSINFGVLVYVIGSIDLSIDDPSSYTIIFPSLNSNGNPFVDSGLLGGTSSSTSLNFSKVGCIATLSIYNSVS